MSRPGVVIVTGLPGTGKTSLARQIASACRLPLFHKDGVKEILFNTLGWRDREWSRMLGSSTYELLFHLLEAELAAGRTLILESNFSNDPSSPRIRALLKQYGGEAFQIYLKAESGTLLDRFRSRAEHGERHPGHLDQTISAAPDFFARAGGNEILALPGSLLEVDTTDFQQVDTTGIIQSVRDFLKGLENSGGSG